MTTLTSLARAHAYQQGRAERITTVRHLHVAPRPLVCVPLAMAGEANAPLAAMVGMNRDRPQLLVVPQPRDRRLRFQFADQLGQSFLGYLGQFAGDHTSRGRPADDGVQLWVPNPRGIEFLRLLGRSTRFRKGTGQYAVPVSVPRFGQWLTFFAEQAEHADSSLLVAATTALGQHWATGQSPLEDANLAALLGWIAPPPGSDGQHAAKLAEDPLLWPPAGPATDITFDKEVLVSAIEKFSQSSTDPAGQQHAVLHLRRALRGQLEPTWTLMWRAIDLLRDLAPGDHVAERWKNDCGAAQRFHTYIAQGGLPQPKRDSAVSAARRLSDLERRRAKFDAQRAFDDPLIMAEYRLSGEAFTGTVTASGPGSRPLRPHLVVATRDRIQVGVGDGPLANAAQPRQHATILEIHRASGTFEISLELQGGMGKGRAPRPGSVPSVGDTVCFTMLTGDYQPRGEFPDRDHTPWTHGGAGSHQPTSGNDAVEEWS